MLCLRRPLRLDVVITRAKRELKEPAGKSSAGFFLGLLLLMATGISHAFTEPSCPSGQTHLWTVNYRNNAISAHACTVNQTFPSMSAMQTTCIPSHGVLTNTGGGAHIGGDVVEPLLVSTLKYAVRSSEHFSSHSISNAGYTVLEATHSCVAATCNSPAGDDMGLVSLSSYNAGLTQACVDNCKANRDLIFTVTLGGVPQAVGGSGTGYRWTSTGESCTGQTGATGQSDSCIVVEDGTGCGVKANPGLVSDGKILNELTPEPDDTVFSGADASNLDDNAACATTQSGRVVCAQNAPTEERPDNGTPGAVAGPDYTITYYAPYGGSTTNSTTYEVYNSSTVNNSTNMGTGGDPNASGSCGAPGQPACATKGSCGGPGQVACKVEVVGDEFSAPGTQYDLGNYSEEIADAESELSAAIGTARSEAAAIFGGGISGGAGSLPCPPPVTIFGQSVTICLTQYEDQLSVIRALVLLMAAVTVIGILLR